MWKRLEILVYSEAQILQDTTVVMRLRHQPVYFTVPNSRIYCTWPRNEPL